MAHIVIIDGEAFDDEQALYSNLFSCLWGVLNNISNIESKLEKRYAY